MFMSGPHSEDLLPTSSVRRVRLDGLTCPPNFGLITGTFPAKHYTRFFVTNQIEIDRLPSFLATPLNERHQLFLKKIQQCRVLFDFSDIGGQIESKQLKAQALREMLDYITTQPNAITDNIYPLVVDMFATNVFRPLPPLVHPIPVGPTFDPEGDDTVVEELAWPHLQLVYEFFLRFVESSGFNTNAAEPYIDQSFVRNLLDLFDSEDSRERDCIKTTLHRIYRTFFNLRAFIRSEIHNVFSQFVYETERHNGIAEMLGIVGSIVEGFKVPLKEAHKSFTMRTLMPLHKPMSLSLYQPQLAYCVAQVLRKDPSLLADVMMWLLKHWPKVNSTKEVMFLNEIEAVLDVVDPAQFQKIEVPLFQQLARSIVSPNFRIAERALLYWNNADVMRLLSPDTVPIVIPALHSSRSHWNRTINDLADNALTVLMEIHPDIFETSVVL
ncbi:protein phosphatase 2A regulatory B subunit [Mycena galericulata]|nr:protein phosphatase 2A regulatory B subunit [Mycena galericulata]